MRHVLCLILNRPRGRPKITLYSHDNQKQKMSVKQIVQVFALICLATNLFSQPASFPSDWMGVWEGQLDIYRGPQKVDDLLMSLEVSPTDQADKYNYFITYGVGEDALRPYSIKLLDSAKGHFVLDEHNGIAIDMFLIGNRLVSTFEVMGSLIQTMTYRSGDKLIYEIIAGDFNAPSMSGDTIMGADTIPAVQAFPMRALQRAELTRVH